MKRLKSVILAAVVVIGAVNVGLAGPLGTGYTYQGRLLQSGNVADGEFDFVFELFDDPCTAIANLIGAPIDLNALDVIDGYFTVELDFGSSVFDGNDRWLQIGVRAGELEDPNEYQFLLPRLRITPAPYALYAKSGTPGPEGPEGLQGIQGEQGLIGDTGDTGAQGPIGLTGAEGPQGLQGIQGEQGLKGDTGVQGPIGLTGPEGAQGIQGEQGLIGDTGDTGPQGPIGLTGPEGPEGPPGDSQWQIIDSNIYYNDGNVGIGTTEPNEELSVVGAISAYNSDVSGVGVRGLASDTNNVYTNYGGWFEAAATTGRGVYGLASYTGSAQNWGGYFEARGTTGKAVYGLATGASGINYGVHGKTNSASGYAGYFEGGRNYFQGNVGIGTTTPGTNKLEVQGGPIKATGGLIIETRTSNPPSPVTGQIWLRTDL